MTWYRYWAAGSFHVEHGRGPVAPVPGAGQNPAAALPSANGRDPGTPPRHPDAGADAGPVAARHIVVVANQKGGVGKTTTAVNVAWALADRGLRTLLVDLDPQANASSGLDARPGDGQPSIYDVLIHELPARKAIIPSGKPGLDLLPSSLALAGAEVELVSAFSREHRLARALAELDDYACVLVDCPPSLGLLTVNALTAGTGVLVPVQCEYYALEGLGSLLQNIELIRLHLNPALATVGYLMTMHDGRTRLSEQVVEEVSRHFGHALFGTRIPRSVRLAEAPSYGRSIMDYDPGSRGAVAYHRVADELVQRLRALDAPSGRPVR